MLCYEISSNQSAYKCFLSGNIWQYVCILCKGTNLHKLKSGKNYYKCKNAQMQRDCDFIFNLLTFSLELFEMPSYFYPLCFYFFLPSSSLTQCRQCAWSKFRRRVGKETLCSTASYVPSSPPRANICLEFSVAFKEKSFRGERGGGEEVIFLEESLLVF